MVAPKQWPREFAASVVAIIFQLKCGDWPDALPQRVQNFGKPLAPSTRVNYLTALRTFFRDLQEWEIIPRRFDPIRTSPHPTLFAPHPTQDHRGRYLGETGLGWP